MPNHTTRSALEALRKLFRLPEQDPLSKKREWVYFLLAELPQPLAPVVKIGKSRDLRWRVITIQYMSPVALRLVGAVSCPAGTEQILHAKFARYRSHGEWFAWVEEIQQFVGTLPKGEPLPAGLAEKWATETGKSFAKPDVDLAYTNWEGTRRARWLRKRSLWKACNPSKVPADPDR